jgi:hypothetical protein
MEAIRRLDHHVGRAGDEVKRSAQTKLALGPLASYDQLLVLRNGSMPW